MVTVMPAPPLPAGAPSPQKTLNTVTMPTMNEINAMLPSAKVRIPDDCIGDDFSGRYGYSLAAAGAAATWLWDAFGKDIMGSTPPNAALRQRAMALKSIVSKLHLLVSV
jgi:hypothetical protein